ncbi:MAG: type II secretion system protein GspJ [Salinisphaeraceae bacterium]|nr:type II secretion system protein GspJ [Salinisphaeraceae bacterium]
MIRQRGFTLLELLIAMAIFAIMSTMAYVGLNQVLQAKADIDERLERTRRMQTAVNLLQTDLNQIAPRSIRDGFGDAQPALLGTPTGSDAAIQFTRNGWRNPLQQPRSHLQRVAYRLDEENRLHRLHWRVLDQAQDSVPVDTVILEDLESMEWRYQDSNAQWQDSWPPLQGGGQLTQGNSSTELPQLIELRLETGDWGELVLLFRPTQAG